LDTTDVGGHVERYSPTEIMSDIQELLPGFFTGLCVTYKCCLKQVKRQIAKTDGKQSETILESIDTFFIE
jgi:hypothetical protein